MSAGARVSTARQLASLRGQAQIRQAVTVQWTALAHGWGKPELREGWHGTPRGCQQLHHRESYQALVACTDCTCLAPRPLCGAPGRMQGIGPIPVRSSDCQQAWGKP